MRVFLDANILFSAAKSDGAIRQLMRLLAQQGHERWVNGYVIAEARRNLEAKGADALGAFEDILAGSVVTRAMPAVSPPSSHWLPDKDRPVLAAAIAASCDALLTGDTTHFGAGYGRRFDGVLILSPRALAELLLK